MSDALEQAALERARELIAALDGLADPAAAVPARELVQLVLDLHGPGLARMLAIVAGGGDGRLLLKRLASDERVRGLMLLHRLHPEALETRAHKAVERLRPHLAVIGMTVREARVVEGALHGVGQERQRRAATAAGRGRAPRDRGSGLRRGAGCRQRRDRRSARARDRASAHGRLELVAGPGRGDRRPG